jgi:molybdenum cofactor cytidylyltransferase
MIEWNIVTEKREGGLPIAAIVLAAGEATRMGQPKQLLNIHRQPMVRRVVESVCAAGLDQVVVITGAYAEEVGKALDGLPVEVVFNPAWRAGMSTSLQKGLRVLRPEIRAALVVLADQPALTSDLVKSLADRYRATEAPAVAPVSHGKRGNPVLFDRALFEELQAVEGDQGGRAVLARHAAQVEQVEVGDLGVLFDVDTLCDYEKAKKMGIGGE